MTLGAVALNPPDDWTITDHAREQMVERRITATALDAVLHRPTHTVPDPKGRADCRYFVRGDLLAVVNERERVVITVGYNGACKDDWKDHRPDEQPEDVHVVTAPVAGVRRVAPLRRNAQQQRVASAPVQKRNMLDGVHEQLVIQVRQELQRRGLDFRAVEVLGPTRVVINVPG